MKTRIVILPSSRFLKDRAENNTAAIVATSLVWARLSFAFFDDRQGQRIFTVYADVDTVSAVLLREAGIDSTVYRIEPAPL